MRTVGVTLIDGHTSVAAVGHACGVGRRTRVPRSATKAVHQARKALHTGRAPVALTLAQKALANPSWSLPASLRSQLHHVVGTALVVAPGGDRTARIEEATEHLEQAATLASSDLERGRALAGLGAIFPQRLIGDRRANYERAIGHGEAAMEALRVKSDPDLLPMVQTNLALAYFGRESGGRLDNLRRAEELLAQAEAARSAARQLEGWVYTQVNLAMVRRAVSDLTGDPIDWRAPLEAVLANRAKLPAEFVGAAMSDLGHAELEIASAAEEEGQDVVAAEARARAGRVLPEARALLADADLPSKLGRSLTDLGDLERSEGRSDGAIELTQRGLAILRASGPRALQRQAAQQLAALHAEDGDWQAAVPAYREALEVNWVLVHSRGAAVDFRAELEAAPRLGRWASGALAQVGDTRVALTVLEEARAVELRRGTHLDSSEVSDLELAQPELAREYATALGESLAITGGPESERASARLSAVLETIHGLAGFEGFGAHVPWTRIVEAAREAPVVFVNPTPTGTWLLGAQRSTEGETEVWQALLPTVRSEDLVMAALLGDPQNGPLVSYLGHATDVLEDPPTTLEEAIDFFLPWIGERVAKPLAEELDRRDVSAVTLVLCGTLAQVPLAACPWSSAGEERCLLDSIRCCYAPSASAHARSLIRFGERNSRRPFLVGLGDPSVDAPLPAGRAELEGISTQFDRARREVTTGAAATKAFFRDHAKTATHLHLACHARASLFDVSDVALELSDGDLGGEDLVGEGIRARLVVLSACASGIPEMLKRPEEALSLSTSFLAAGAVCTITTLWPVNDFATALLVLRFYEELMSDSNSRPDEALRQAQAWLQALQVADERDFVDGYPELERQYEALASTGHLPGQRSSGVHPYRPPIFWAGFIATGR